MRIGERGPATPTVKAGAWFLVPDKEEVEPLTKLLTNWGYRLEQTANDVAGSVAMLFCLRAQFRPHLAESMADYLERAASLTSSRVESIIVPEPGEQPDFRRRAH